MDDVGDILSNIYFDPAHVAGFRGEKALTESVKNQINKSEVKKWLQAQDSYTLHKPLRYKYPMLRYNVSNIDDLWEIDLIDMQSLKSYNDNTSFLLACIDVLSKYAWVLPLYNKTNIAIKKAFEELFEKTDRRPVMIQSDSGKEFMCKIVQDFFKDNDIQFRRVRNPDVKAAVIERFNRNLKTRMFRYFTFSNTKRYIDVLQKLVDAYNHTKHSSIKIEPASVTLENAHIALRNLRKKYKPVERKAKYKVNQQVRISRKRGVFEKGYEAGWSEEVFTIARVLHHKKSPVYELIDYANQPIDGFFYEEELNPVIKTNDTEYIVERIVGTTGRGKNKKYLIKWVGYPESMNSWIPASDLKNL